MAILLPTPIDPSTNNLVHTKKQKIKNLKTITNYKKTTKNKHLPSLSIIKVIKRG